MNVRDEVQKSNAVVITNGWLTTPFGKTAHGLIRGSERFDIVGIIDPPHAGRDAGELVDGIRRDIPIFADLAAAMAKGMPKPRYAIIGVAPAGGGATRRVAAAAVGYSGAEDFDHQRPAYPFKR